MPKKLNSPSLEQWKRLYELMAEIKNLKPWEYMYEHEVFAVESPNLRELGLVSVMGNLGEHFSIAAYIGQHGFTGFNVIQSMGYDLTPDVILQIPQLQASFEDREMLDAEDKKIIKQLGLKYRGANAWVQFRSYRPGCFPWHLEDWEADVLIAALEQLLIVAPRFEEDESLLEKPTQQGKYFTRVFNHGQWEDAVKTIKFPPLPPIALSMNMSALEYLKGMKQENAVVELHLEMTQEIIKDKEDERPYFSFMLLAADQKNGMILGLELLKPLPNMDAMWGSVPEKVVEILANSFHPKEIRVLDSIMESLLLPLTKETKIKVKVVKRLPAIEQAFESFQEFMKSKF